MERYLAEEEEEEDRVNALYLQREMAHTYPQQAFSGAFLTRTTRTTIHIPPREPAARAPSLARSGSSISSITEVCFDKPQRRVSSAYSDSTAPPLTGAPPWFRRANPTSPDPAVYTYELPCEFSFANCHVRFAPDQWGDWVSHSFAHFPNACLPKYAICTFCDDRAGIFEDFTNPESNWRERMIHMGEHFQNDQSLRPDFFVIKHMKSHGLISQEDFADAMLYTERPTVKYLVSRGDKTKGRIQQEEKILQEVDDLRKEKRIMQREKQQIKGKQVDRPS